MEFAVVPVSALRKRDQWKVEYFVAGASNRSSTTYPMVTLGEVLLERRETLDPTEFPRHTFNYVGLENVESHTGDLVEFAPCLGDKVRSRSKIFRNSDVLYGRLRPYLNKVLFVSPWLSTGICSGEFIVLQADPERLNAEFCRYLLASALVQERVSALQVGSTHPRLGVSDLYDIEVALPPVDVQERMLLVIRESERRRRQAKADAGAMASQLSTALIGALETGGELAVPTQSTVMQPTYDNLLPVQYRESRQGRRLL